MTGHSPIAALERLPNNPLVVPAQIPYADASGAFNAGACVDHRSGRVVLLVRAYERATGRSSLALALSRDGVHFDEIRPEAALARVAPYEEWGVEDARVTYIADEQRYAITYTGYSPAGPRVCLVTTDDLLDTDRWVRHGPRLAGENKNCVVFPRRVGGQYVILHRPMPRIVCVRVNALEDEWRALYPIAYADYARFLAGWAKDHWRSNRHAQAAVAAILRRL